MAGGLHGGARTTRRLRAALQASNVSSRALAARDGLNPRTVAKWRRRTTTADAPRGSKTPKRTGLTSAGEAMAFRQKTLLPLDDVLGGLKEAIANLGRSACTDACRVTACPGRRVEQKAPCKRFKTCEIGYVHIDGCELRHADGRLIVFLAIDRVSTFTQVEVSDKAGKMGPIRLAQQRGGGVRLPTTSPSP